MDTPGLELNFKVLYMLGIWNPGFQSKIMQVLYSLYSATVRFIFVLHFVLNFPAFFFQNNVQSSFRLINMSLLEAVATLKLLMVQRKREEINEMLKILNLNICKAKNKCERDILRICINKARYIVKPYFIINTISSVIISTGPMMINSATGSKGRTLPFRNEKFYSMNNTAVYVWTYLYDLFIASIGMVIEVFTEGLILGIMILPCGQYDLLHHRLLNATTYHEIRDCIRHHQQILRFSQCIQDVFGAILLIKFLSGIICISCLTLITSLEKTYSARLDCIILLLAVLYQLLLLCWNGDELFTKSQDIAVATLGNKQWINLSSKSKKALMIMAIRSYNTPELKAGSILNLSLEVFTSVLKASYSAFNLFQQMSTD